MADPVKKREVALVLSRSVHLTRQERSRALSAPFACTAADLVQADRQTGVRAKGAGPKAPAAREGGLALVGEGLVLAQRDLVMKKPRWLLRGLRSYPGVFLPNGVMVPALVAVSIDRSTHPR